MKKVLSIFIITAVVITGNVTFPFATDHVHDWSDWIVWEESTCETQGEEYRYCDSCGEREWRRLPLEPHDWSKWKTYKAKDCLNYSCEYRECLECWEYEERNIKGRGPHDWYGWETVRRATPYRTGLKKNFCLKCDKVKRKTIPKQKLTSNQKKAIRVVKYYLKAAKSYDIKKMNACFKTTRSKYGYPTKEIDWVYKRYNKKLKWEVLNVSGRGNTITVKVDVVRPDFYLQAYDAYYEAVEWGINHPNKATNTVISNKFSGKYNRKVKKCTKDTSIDTVTFKMVKLGNKWKIKAKTMAIVDIATAFYWRGSQDAYETIIDEYS